MATGAGSVLSAHAARRVGGPMPHAAPEAAPAIAILIPCFNEALTIARVIQGFRQGLPQARIYVYDNNSTDGTAGLAEDAGAEVRVERRQGKGHVVRRMFADIEADCYVLVDGDDTYDAEAAAAMSALVLEHGYDFINASRVTEAALAYRRGHRFGNRLLTRTVQLFFGRHTSDMLSGYKALSRRFVKSFPAMSGGFEIETELTVHALEMRMPMREIAAPYRERPTGSASKLRTVQDGMRILLLIARLVKDERPRQVFGLLGLAAGAAGLLLGLPVVLAFLDTGLVPRLPTAVLSVGLVLIGWLSIFAGIILDVVAKGRRETKRLAYLAVKRFGA
jgi:hypothetical protein